MPTPSRITHYLRFALLSLSLNSCQLCSNRTARKNIVSQAEAQQSGLPQTIIEAIIHFEKEDLTNQGKVFYDLIQDKANKSLLTDKKTTQPIIVALGWGKIIIKESNGTFIIVHSNKPCLVFKSDKDCKIVKNSCADCYITTHMAAPMDYKTLGHAAYGDLYGNNKEEICHKSKGAGGIRPYLVEAVLAKDSAIQHMIVSTGMADKLGEYKGGNSRLSMQGYLQQKVDDGKLKTFDILNSNEAARAYNAAVKAGKKTGLALHTTC